MIQLPFQRLFHVIGIYIDGITAFRHMSILYDKFTKITAW